MTQSWDVIPFGFHNGNIPFMSIPPMKQKSWKNLTRFSENESDRHIYCLLRSRKIVSIRLP